jgi:hypothetical protein
MQRKNRDSAAEVRGGPAAGSAGQVGVGHGAQTLKTTLTLSDRGDRSYDRDHHVPEMRRRDDRGDADERLPVLLHLPVVQRVAAASTG